MKIGIFADTHDHIDNIRRAVERFNAEQVELVLFAGDLVSTFCVPHLRNLNAKIVACYGDNEGNKIGLQSGFKLVGQLSEPPVFVTTGDGTRFVITHMKRQLRGLTADYDIAVFGHTHKPRIDHDDQGRMLINPGETSGWTFGRPTIVLLETTTRQATIVDLAVPPDTTTGATTTGAPHYSHTIQTVPANSANERE
jgi:putative phosphoesterase